MKCQPETYPDSEQTRESFNSWLPEVYCPRTPPEGFVLANPINGAVELLEVTSQCEGVSDSKKTHKPLFVHAAASP